VSARFTEGQRLYRAACRASAKASAARANLPPGASRAKVTSANATWKSHAEERERLGALLTPTERAAVDALESL
jgi:hypothetical protein